MYFIVHFLQIVLKMMWPWFHTHDRHISAENNTLYDKANTELSKWKMVTLLINSGEMNFSLIYII